VWVVYSGCIELCQDLPLTHMWMQLACKADIQIETGLRSLAQQEKEREKETESANARGRERARKTGGDTERRSEREKERGRGIVERESMHEREMLTVTERLHQTLTNAQTHLTILANRCTHIHIHSSTDIQRQRDTERQRHGDTQTHIHVHQTCAT